MNIFMSLLYQPAKHGPKASAIGYGAMVLEGNYGAADEVVASSA